MSVSKLVSVGFLVVVATVMTPAFVAAQGFGLRGNQGGANNSGSQNFGSFSQPSNNFFSPPPPRPQNTPNWGNLGLQLGMGIANQAIQNANRQNSLRPPRGAAPAPNSQGTSNFGRFDNSLFNSNDRYRGNTSYPQSQRVVRPSSSNYYTPSQSNAYTPSYSTSTNSYTPAYSEPPIAPKVYSKLPIEIRCPSWCEGRCQFSLVSNSGKEYVYSIKAGEKQAFSETTDWKIRFDQGNGRGYKTFRLRGGQNYELHSQDNGGWAFYTARSE